MRGMPKSFRALVGMMCLASALVPARSVAVETAGSAFGEEFRLDEAKPGNRVVTCNHLVPHTSTVAANRGELVDLFVRERVRSTVSEERTCAGSRDQQSRPAVLMIHGRSVPVVPGFDLEADDRNRGHYSWALELARAGIDVFMLDFQGSGLSPRPRMENPCNVPKTDQMRALIPYQLSAPCNPEYAFQLVTSQSDWNELDTVVDFIRDLNHVDTVHLVSWSQGSFRIGPYAVQHPEKVASLFLYAPIYNPVFRSGTGPDGFSPPVKLPQPGTPMTLTTKADLLATWNAETRCEGQLEEGTQDLVWNAIMANDPVGRGWGPPPAGTPTDSDSGPEGVMRVRTPFLWGWNANIAARLTVPVLIISGEFDLGDGGIQALPELYQTVQSTKKLRFKVQCAGHRMVWESQRTLLHEMSKAWIKDGEVAGFDRGEFFVDVEGHLFPM